MLRRQAQIAVPLAGNPGAIGKAENAISFGLVADPSATICAASIVVTCYLFGGG